MECDLDDEIEVVIAHETTELVNRLVAENKRLRELEATASDYIEKLETEAKSNKVNYDALAELYTKTRGDFICLNSHFESLKQKYRTVKSELYKIDCLLKETFKK